MTSRSTIALGDAHVGFRGRIQALAVEHAGTGLPAPELERRLIGRGTEDPEERLRRLRTAEIELAAMKEFDVTIVNDDVATAAAELVDLLRFGTSADSRPRNA